MKFTAIIFCVLIIAGCSEAEAKNSTAGIKASITRSYSSTKTSSSRSSSPSYVSEKAKQARKSKSVLSGTEYVYYPLGDCKRWVTFNFNGYRCIGRD
ncbi:hypothetical protein [Acinetobacter pittii]|uniref:hypothetical protein n=1 Tax=Acinetobacter pittii TaxID=48296 RepID=UPI000F736353|nr:hypothetical protein [Acinetobacter pittii]RSO48450.1 hypothetical protein EA757_07130 [Acinetobacter pittii]RSO77840.1 hypothetical protein EA753_08040 [Acinetobacter pittii]HIN56130.1 hypothetical protein [Acinetobacter pittii]